jgi:hypothetical protein
MRKSDHEGAVAGAGSRPEITAIEAGTMVPDLARPKPSARSAMAAWVALPTFEARLVVESEQEAGWRGMPTQQFSRKSTAMRR